MSIHTITKTLFFEASPQTVWAFLTEKDKISQWFMPADVDMTVGQDYHLTSKNDDGTEECGCWGKVLSADPYTRLVQTFAVKPFREGAFSTLVWTLEELDGGTKLTLQHEGVVEAMEGASLPIFMSLDKGWDGFFVNIRGILNASAEEEQKRDVA
ncbi:SRPBCC family protein [Cohaesibacter gelatinilyticus]|uniref:Uncharacterized conserved protein YndB, AHSA1/START domain n=1 Tax=Cohaesibacter gelatinilyticus TaxID=372072 RepID=A0A285NBJ4_9HYPH|nr:SRPBCC domain-containing protein [Cohaesibacter gelatinilyticus]SNZ06293.1 Uncharacterized conserved protein YndB, AHSA1/START domain [Cohaesibacter gelatinilyticus]